MTLWSLFCTLMNISRRIRPDNPQRVIVCLPGQVPTRIITRSNVWPTKILVFRLHFLDRIASCRNLEGSKTVIAMATTTIAASADNIWPKKILVSARIFSTEIFLLPYSLSLCFYLFPFNYNYNEEAHYCRCGASFFHLEATKQKCACFFVVESGDR